MPTSPQNPRVLRFDGFELDVRAGELSKRGARLRLKGQPLEVLARLLRQAGDVVTREELRAQIWPADTFVDFDHSLHNAIARLREVLGDSAAAPRYIETLPRKGYRFIGRVEEVRDEPRPEPPSSNNQSAVRIRRIAVLPLEDLSENATYEYFADGMTEALITSLAKIKALRVISRTSAMRYKGVRRMLPQIARELNVDAVIEGSVVRADDRVRISAQLIHATSDQHLWAESYERDFRDILSVQSEIAQQVADEVSIILTPEERVRLGKARRVDPQAHEWYLKARYHWNKRTEDSVKKAHSYFQRAIDNDPTYAQGYAGLADCYNILGYYSVVAPQEAYAKGKAAAERVLELDPTLAEPHATLGVVKRDYEWDWVGAEEEFRRAVELDPGYTEAYHWRGTLFSMLGRHEEAIREKKRALEIDPLSVVIRTDLARMFYFARDYDQSLDQYRAALDMDADFGSAHLGLAQVYEQTGILDRAISELRTGLHLCSDSTLALAKLGHGYAVADRREEARDVLKMLNESPAPRYVSPFDIALVYVGLGEYDDAFAWLQKAFQQRSHWLGYLNVEPQLDPIRGDPRYEDLLRGVGLTQSSTRSS